ncbi:methylglyoxal synthase [Streptomyces sp. NPDC048419]|uniref:methylglyoxal synthase n=1 Tax=Streptomyces sp. NPDC048419 TaxID=3365547 RepID=UPI00371A4441
METIPAPQGILVHIILIAQEGKKSLMAKWATHHKEFLASQRLTATGGTAEILRSIGLTVRALDSGQLGGDVHAAHIVASEQPGACFFFRDPLAWPGHDADATALVRLAVLHDVPLAMNQATADALVASFRPPAREPHDHPKPVNGQAATPMTMTRRNCGPSAGAPQRNQR